MEGLPTECFLDEENHNLWNYFPGACARKPVWRTVFAIMLAGLPHGNQSYFRKPSS